MLVSMTSAAAAHDAVSLLLREEMDPTMRPWLWQSRNAAMTQLTRLREKLEPMRRVLVLDRQNYHKIIAGSPFAALSSRNTTPVAPERNRHADAVTAAVKMKAQPTCRLEMSDATVVVLSATVAEERTMAGATTEKASTWYAAHEDIPTLESST